MTQKPHSFPLSVGFSANELTRKRGLNRGFARSLTLLLIENLAGMQKYTYKEENQSL